MSADQACTAPEHVCLQSRVIITLITKSHKTHLIWNNVGADRCGAALDDCVLTVVALGRQL